MEPLDPRTKMRIGMVLVIIGILMSPELLSLSAIRNLRDVAVAIHERANEVRNP